MMSKTEELGNEASCTVPKYNTIQTPHFVSDKNVSALKIALKVFRPLFPISKKKIIYFQSLLLQRKGSKEENC